MKAKNHNKFWLIVKACCIFLLLGLAACSEDDSSNEGIVESGLEPMFPCINGSAGPYPCNDYDMMGRVNAQTLGGPGAEVNDSWGWTDTSTDKEYALVGTTTGTAFVDISDPANPRLLGRLPSATVNSSWRDIKVYNDHAFIVSEAENHGMQVFDLKKLRGLTGPSQSFTADARYTGFGNAHNIVINENSAFAYAVGTQTFEGGPHFVDITNPINPQAAGGFAGGGYSHDAQAVIYNGPDSDYAGRELFIGSNHNSVVIVDVTDKENPELISEISYNDLAYPHQGWFTEDQKYFIMGDELDELNSGYNTRSLILDFTDLDNPKVHLEYLGPTKAIDHNGYVHGNLYFLANYTAGVRIVDISQLNSGVMSEIGFFDTFPQTDQTSLDGAWNVYPFFSSGNIIVSDIQGGLFIIRKSGS